jgi:hypothetical protein
VTSAGVALPAGPPRFVQLGRTFLHPVLDYLLIGGGLSLVAGLLLPGSGQLYSESRLMQVLPWCILAFNSAHFAASTLRLYTREGAFREWPFLTLAFPLVSIAVLGVAMLVPALGRNVYALYLTWSPFHYAAQAFGLSAMYSYRSGCRLDASDRRLLRAACMLPFLYAFSITGTSGIGWFVPAEVFAAHPLLALTRARVELALAALSFVAPLLLVLRLGRRGQAFPLISLLIMLSNGIWWIVFTYLQAFLWATVFHGIQYLAIVTIFHVREQRERPNSRHGAVVHALGFYAACLVLGYLLFEVWPYAFVWAGFPLSQSLLLVSAVVNIHHFVVDRYIWRLRRDPNYRIVVGGASSR